MVQLFWASLMMLHFSTTWGGYTVELGCYFLNDGKEMKQYFSHGISYGLEASISQNIFHLLLFSI